MSCAELCARVVLSNCRVCGIEWPHPSVLATKPVCEACRKRGDRAAGEAVAAATVTDLKNEVERWKAEAESETKWADLYSRELLTAKAQMQSYQEALKRFLVAMRRRLPEHWVDFLVKECGLAYDSLGYITVPEAPQWLTAAKERAKAQGGIDFPFAKNHATGDLDKEDT